MSCRHCCVTKNRLPRHTDAIINSNQSPIADSDLLSINKMAVNLAALFKRPLNEQVDKKDQTINVIPSPQEHLYIRNCVNCKFVVAGPLLKCTIERCQSLTVVFLDKIIAGLMELISSKGVTVTIAENSTVPTISMDGSSNIHLYLHEPKAIGIIHTVGVDDVTIHFDPPYMSEQKLDHPPNDGGEFITKCSVGKIFTEKCIREGSGYMTTVKEKERSDKIAAEFEEKMVNYVASMIHSKGEKPTEKNDKPTPTQPKTKPINVEESGSLSNALKQGKEGLKPTETVERQIPVVGVESGASRGGLGQQYNLKDEEEKKEYFDKDDVLDKKVKKVAEWIKTSKHVIVFTGAGISTSAGIPDFRSGMDTVLPTGPGVWEVRAQGTARANSKVVPILRAMPTSTHMSIVKLHETGLCKFTVSQNVDGLHRRSGLPPAELAELHGNTNLETCKKCNRQYLRDFETREAQHVFDHTTSRQCDDTSCKGQLKDSIINFGENLPETELKKAFDHAQKADLCIVLGSSLRVRPACQVPEVVFANGGKVVICNLQKIPQFPQNSRTLPVYIMCDQFITKLMHELQLDIPKFLLSRRVKITNENKGDNLSVTIADIDVDEDIPYSFIKYVSDEEGKTISKRPFMFVVPMTTTSLKLTLGFHGHYGEPPLVLEYKPADKTCLYWMEYDVMEGQWHQMSKKNQ